MTPDMTVPERLAAIADLLKATKTPPRVTVRDFLWWWKASRRGYWVVEQIRKDLDRHHLETEPDFESAYLDSQISFSKKGTRTPEPTPPHKEATDSGEQPSADPFPDTTNRIRRLAAANRPPTFVAPAAPLSQVTTLMLLNDFSQVPVMTSPRDVKGVVTWRDIGSRLALGKPLATAADAMEAPTLIDIDASLFSVLPLISHTGYVLVQEHRTITGILTGTDIADQFHFLTEPFLLLGEIENTLRRFLSAHFSPTELSQRSSYASTADRAVTSVTDLTFGEYQRLLEDPQRWEQTRTRLDRKTFIDTLNKLRSIRNDVMHFDPDGITADDLRILREAHRFFRELDTLGLI